VHGAAALLGLFARAAVRFC
jgi:hypothetical protein